MSSSSPPIDYAPVRATPPIVALQAFEHAARCRSFQQAAAELAVTPSAISHQIRGLERYFGVQLFVREGRTVRLTRQGERFLDDVREGLTQLDRASRRLLRTRASAGDELRIRVAPAVAHTLLFGRLPEFEADHPRWRLSLETASATPEWEPEEPDITIQLGRSGSSDVRAQALLAVRLAPVAAAACAVRDLTDPHELVRQRLIKVRGEPFGWSSWLARAGVVDGAPREIWVESLAAALEAAEQGLGVALAPYPLILARRSGPRRLRVASPPCNAPSDMVYLARRPDRRDGRRVVAFTTWLTAVVAELAAANAPCQPQRSESVFA